MKILRTAVTGFLPSRLSPLVDTLDVGAFAVALQ